MDTLRNKLSDWKQGKQAQFTSLNMVVSVEFFVFLKVTEDSMHWMQIQPPRSFHREFLNGHLIQNVEPDIIDGYHQGVGDKLRVC